MGCFSQLFLHTGVRSSLQKKEQPKHIQSHQVVSGADVESPGSVSGVDVVESPSSVSVADYVESPVWGVSS